MCSKPDISSQPHWPRVISHNLCSTPQSGGLGFYEWISCAFSCPLLMHRGNSFWRLAVGSWVAELQGVMSNQAFVVSARRTECLSKRGYRKSSCGGSHWNLPKVSTTVSQALEYLDEEWKIFTSTIYIFESRG